MSILQIVLLVALIALAIKYPIVMILAVFLVGWLVVDSEES